MPRYRHITRILALLCVTIQLDAVQYRCINPNGNKGYCVSISECPSLTEVVAKLQLTIDEILFLQNSRCENGFGPRPHVCCTPDKEFNNKEETTEKATTTESPEPECSTPSPKPVIPTIPTVAPSPSNGAGNVLPKPPHCGYNILGDKIYNGNDTAIDEYPWMVLLEYIDHGVPGAFKCGGSLINQRYVLTAAHCVIGDVLTLVGPLVAIHLGEYDTSTEIDCIEDDCNDNVIVVGIEAAIPHPQFKTKDKSRHYDIALIRLATDVEFTYFIRPICLPTERTNLFVGEPLVVAGWGRTLLGSHSNTKKQLNVPYNDFEECAEKYAKARFIRILPSQFCAGGEFGKDSCDSDSGGPLMRQGIHMKWFLEGIISFGNRCGLEGWPGVYTRVFDYMDWIRKTLRP